MMIADTTIIKLKKTTRKMAYPADMSGTFDKVRQSPIIESTAIMVSPKTILDISLVHDLELGAISFLQRGSLVLYGDGSSF